MNRKYIILAFILAILLSSFGGSCVADRPILRLPDAHNDRMKKSIFIGEAAKDHKLWLYKVTMVKTDFDSASLIPHQSATKAGRFVFTRDKLQFQNAVTRQSLEETEVARQGIEEIINEWDIKHSELRLKEIDGWTINQEEENNYLQWYEKSHFTVNWETANVSETASFPYFVGVIDKFHCYKKAGSRLIDGSRDIQDDYISWTIAVVYEQDPLCAGKKNWVRGDFTKTVHYKYSFKTILDPSQEDYTPYMYAGEEDPLFKKYGYFTTVRQGIASDGRDKNLFYMNRWNPNKKHVFYFSKDYLEEYKDIAHGVICAANKLFARHGLSDYPLDGRCKEDGSVVASDETCTTGICFELRENTGQEIGDIRYSFFHLTPLKSFTFGYGPSDPRPDTGEIVSGNVFVSTYGLDFYLKYFLQDRWMRDRANYTDENGEPVEGAKTKYETGSLFLQMKRTLKENDHNLWTATSARIDKDSPIRADFEYLLHRFTFANPASWPFTRGREQSSQNDEIESLFDERGQRPLSQFIPQTFIEESKNISERFYESAQKEALSQSQPNGTIYPFEPVMAMLPDLLANGMSPEEIKRRILFNVMTHELGHVLNLRHNFYGSFDAHHHPKNEEGEVILKTSSVMDYMNIKDEAEGPPRALFGPYDEAALVYAYSNGEKDLSLLQTAHNSTSSSPSQTKQNRNYLFCTDGHVFLNFLCSRWDRGSAPSEVMMSLIERYEEMYFIRNLRAGRAYWDTSGYPYGIFYDFFNIKQALMMWRTAFRDNLIRERLDEAKRDYTEDEKSFISSEIQEDIRQALKLSVAFYNSVLQLSQADRDWKSHYNEDTGALERVGIGYDKQFAMLFLMGDDRIPYNPNHFLGKSSYLTYIGDMGFRQMMEEIMENALTVRVDMDPWFIGMARYLYAKNASNVYNIALNGNGTLLEKIAVRRYSGEGLRRALGIDPLAFQVRPDSLPDRLDTAVVNMEDYLETITDPYYYGTNEQLAITYFDGCYYTASSNLNKYSFTIIDRMRRVLHAEGDSLRQAKQDVYDMFYLYNSFKFNGVVPQNCDDGI